MLNNEKNWHILSKQLNDELNVIKRDALVPYVVSVEDGIENARNLYEQFLLDVEMGSCGTTSKIEEAIAAVQLYIHRYFVNLEEISVKEGKNPDEIRKELKNWWKWMKNYRVWEANRKVFLYPENYIRPELRDTKTPAFKTLEEDLLQGEINALTVQRVYKKYLDEYTEVSRLKIAGGYVYDLPGSNGKNKRLVLFGRTKTDPARFYYRLAEFFGGEKGSTSWSPWLNVNVQIDADKVYPVFAFERVFVFWTKVETVVDTSTSTTITTKQSNDTQTIASNSQATYIIKIYYSFYNLNKEWLPAQTLTAEIKEQTAIENVKLFVENSDRLQITVEDERDKKIIIKEHENIIINCTYQVKKQEFNEAFSLTPELYTEKANKPKFDNNGKEVFNAIFDDTEIIDDNNVVMFNTAEKSSEGLWFSFDHKGGSFLCKPDVTPLGNYVWKNLRDNKDSLPTWDKIDAAFQAPDGKSYFFNNSGNYAIIGPNGLTTSKTQYRWGKVRNNIAETGIIDAAFVDGNKTYFFSGNQYLVYTNGYELADSDYPKTLNSNTEGLPQWDKIDAAFKGTDGKTYFFNQTRKEFVESSNLNKPIATNSKWGKIRNSFTAPDYRINSSLVEPSVDAAFVFGNYTYLINKEQFIKYANSDYQFIENGYPKPSNLYTVLEDLGCRNNNNLYRDEDITAALDMGSTVYFSCVHSQNNRRKNYEFSNGNISETNITGAWTAAFAIGNTKYIFQENRLSVSNGRETTTPLNFSVNAALVGKDGNIYIFRNREYIVFPNIGINTEVIVNKINQWADSKANSGKWGRIRNRIAEQGIVDAAFVHSGKTYFFSGNEYLVYSTNYDLADEGYPKPIITNGEGFPAWNKIDAVFKTIDNKIYFFDNAAKQFVESGKLSERKSTKERWGIVRNNFTETGIVDSAYINGNRLFLTSANQFIRYTLSSGNEPGEFVDKDYHKNFSLLGLTKVYGAFVYNEITYLVGENRFLKFTKVDDRVFSEGRRETGKLGALLNDMGFANVPPDYQNLQIHGAYVYNQVLYIYSPGYVLACSLTDKRITPLDTSSNSFQLAYVNEAGALQKATSSPYDAAFVAGGKFYLFKGNEYIESSKIPATFNDIDWKNPKKVTNIWGISKIDASFSLNGKVYLFSNDRYFKLEGSNEIDTLTEFKYIQGNWGNLPYELRTGFDAAFHRGNELFFFKNNRYIKYENITDARRAKPYELGDVNYEIVRLTTSTAYKLNQKLLSGGVQALLNISTQETDELPSFSDKESSATNIKVKTGKIENLPISSHLDFNSANGIYYWEVFFHAPFLIAQSLNTGQKFEEAKEWYEYIFDPTEPANYWKFLPFLAVDIQAIVDSGRSSIAQLKALGINVTKVETNLNTIFSKLEPLVDVFQYLRQLSATESEYLKSLNLKNIRDDLEELVRSLNADNEQVSKLINKLSELTGVIEKLWYRYQLMQVGDAEINAYLNDPFDPHAIASLRTTVYRKSIVMGYVDNLIDWGDMLFRQYTRESINEARMLYILAYDLLGQKPANLGTKVLSTSKKYSELTNPSDDYNFLISPATTPHVGSQPITIIPGTPNDSIANPYFFIPDNSLFADYWDRVEDRLYKIRHCQNIMGINQPLPLFQPPIDPMAIVQAVSSGAALSAALASMNISVPHYRFSFMVRKAQELVQKLNQFGNDLLGALEKKDAEELNLLQNRQDGVILAMTRDIKKSQLEEARESVKVLEESLRHAKSQVGYYQKLIAAGLSVKEKTQLDLMIAGASLMYASVALKIASGIIYVVPETTLGPFSLGVETGGRHLGDSVSSAAEATEILGEALSMTGEIIGMQASQDRMKEDWQSQLVAVESDVIQITAQLNGARWQEKIAQREIDILEKEIEHNESIKTFMKDKFTSAQLYQWMVSKLSGMYFQTYNMAYDMAKSAEKAFQFEQGYKESDVNYIQPLYWDNLKKGLLSGESLSMDIDKMEKAYIETNSRRFEISKNISLLDLDPVALLQLKTKGACEFSLTEALFDYDFQGHYCRQVKTISLTFNAGEGQTVNATLTQLSHKTILEPDAKAVKYLLNAKDQPPLSIRSDWKTNQQIALSHVNENENNNGLFELRFDDDRYLPFEGTGAVSTWRLELNGKKGSYNLNQLQDVTINIKYTALQGGTVFANAVKGLLKPYQTARFFNVANEFPDEWEEFLENDDPELVLTFTRDMFPNMSSNKIAGIYTKYELTDQGQVSMVLNNDKSLTLKDGKYLLTNGLSIGSNGSDWTLSLNGNKEIINNIGLVLSYKAIVG